MYGSDGSFTTCSGYKTLAPIPAVQEVASETSPQRVQDTLVLSESGDEYAGQVQVDFLDASGKVVFSTSGEVKGETRDARPGLRRRQVGKTRRRESQIAIR